MVVNAYSGDLHMQISYPRVKTFSNEVFPLAPSPLESGQYFAGDRILARIEAVQGVRVDVQEDQLALGGLASATELHDRLRI